MLVLIVIVGFGAGAYFAVALGTPSVEELKEFGATEGTRVYADDDALIHEFKVDKGIYVPLKSIPDALKNAVIAVE
ncbi:MAG: penicillin-binding protein, partial [Nitrospirae bacterium]|nr:penicillin-binding protein [Nitrospirota bacterium]